MTLFFKSIRWRNFLSTGNDWTEIDFTAAKSTLIVGENGAGKSTILDAICFALYNKPFRKINKPLLINSINGKGLLVEVEFMSGKDIYVVRRGIKPGVFEIEKNGNLISQDAANRDYQESLEKYILKLNYKSFCQVVILGSASFVPFMQLPAGHRREIVEDLLDIQIFTVMNMLLKDRMSANSRELMEVDYKIDLTNEKIKMQEDHLRSMQTNAQELISELVGKIEKHRGEIETEKKIIDEKRAEQEAMIKTTLGYESMVKKANEMHSLRGQLNDKIARLNSEVKFFSEHENCPTCMQVIDSTFKADAMAKKAVQIDETGEGLAKIEDMYRDAETKIAQMKKVLDDIHEINIDVKVKSNKIKSIESSIASLNEQIESINRRNMAHEDTGALKKLEDDLAAVADEKKALFEVKEIHKVVSSLLKDTGIKARIIKQYIPIINKLINKYLAAMDFFVQFELNENFDETIKSRFRDEFSYSSFSEGEKMRINLAILFAWRAIAKIRNSASTNLLILDEVFDGSLDSAGTEEFLKILHSIVGDTNTFIISHKTDQLLDKFERVIRFEKKNNFSRIAA